MPHPATLAVHAGRSLDPPTAGATTPVELSTTFRLTEAVYDAVLEPARLRHLPFYTRLYNPNQRAVARKISALEGAEDALVFSSGMAAITSTLRAVLEPGDTLVVARSLYGTADAWIHRELPRFRVRVLQVDLEDTAALDEALKGARALYFEPISNPLLEVADVPGLAAKARAAGALSIVDNTFLSPINFRPLEHGIDLVLHSATKYLNGHSDVIAGCVAGSVSLIERIYPHLTSGGGCLDPHAAYLLERGMKTLELRMGRHNENGLAIARALSGNQSVDRVFYPGLPEDTGYARAQALFPGQAGGVVSFEVRGGSDAARRVLSRLDQPDGPFMVATSLGGVESLVSMPSNTSHPWSEMRARMGISEGLIRCAAGIEDHRDLIAALIDALDTEADR